jgi:hypothetical protein
MLRLKDVSSHISKIFNKSDYYAQIKILLENEDDSEGVCYWNAYGKSSSLVQMSMSNPMGSVYEILVFIRPILRYHIDADDAIIQKNAIEKIGSPLFETYIEKYQSDYYHLDDENIDFHVYVTEKNITILLCLNTVTLHVINDRIVFGFDKDNNLCYIHIKNAILNDEGFLEFISTQEH